MDVTNRDVVSLISVIPLLIIRQSSIHVNITVQQFFFARRHRRRRFQLHHLQGLSAFYLHLRARRALDRRPRRARVFPRLQNWFQQLLKNNSLIILSHANTIQGIPGVVNSLQPCLVSCRKQIPVLVLSRDLRFD